MKLDLHSEIRALPEQFKNIKPEDFYQHSNPQVQWVLILMQIGNALALVLCLSGFSGLSMMYGGAGILVYRFFSLLLTLAMIEASIFLLSRGSRIGWLLCVSAQLGILFGYGQFGIGIFFSIFAVYFLTKSEVTDLYFSETENATHEVQERGQALNTGASEHLGLANQQHDSGSENRAHTEINEISLAP